MNRTRILAGTARRGSIMEIIGAAALIAVGIVLAAVIYGRTHGARTALATGANPTAGAPVVEVVARRDPGGGDPGGGDWGGGSPNLQAAVLERTAAVARREEALARREGELEKQRGEAVQARQELERALEQVSGLSAGRAQQLLLKEGGEQAKHDGARRIRQIEEETKREAERRVRNILSVCMQRLAAGHAAETTVSGVQLTADDTQGAVVLSGFDGVRREIARLTLEKLLLDGRIHPARIEEMYYQAKSELESRIVEMGEQAVFDAGVQSVHPELVKVLGRLRFRTSYGQNVLAHSIEVSQLAAMMAAELGASARTARRAALLHDIGKAVTHEVEGPHALVGGELARKYGESEAVAHAMEAHHNEVEPQTIEAVIVQAADALSGARPGARGESLEQYVKRLRDLEQIATRHKGVDKVYAMQAGREIRVMVAPGAIDDDAATLLSYEIAREIEKELEYPGQIKVTVIRESRAVEYAR